MTKQKNRKSNGFFNLPALIVTVTTVLLVISVIAEIFIPTYHTNPLLYGLMGTVVGLTINSIKNK